MNAPVTIEERPHARFSPSAGKRWLNCPASVHLQPGVTPRAGGPAADEGTAAHAMAQDAILTRRRGFDYLMDGAEFVVGSKAWPVTAEMADAVDLYLDTLAEYPDSVYEIHVEDRVECPTVHENCGGTPDIWAYNERRHRLAILDLKYGMNPVEVVQNGHPNEQLLIYAIGVTRELQARGLHVTHIDLVIVQPRAPHKDGPVRKITVMEGHLAAYERAFRDAAADTSRLCAGNWCKWCNNEHVCPALLGDVDKVLEATLHPVDTLTLTDIAEMLDLQPRINSYFAALKAHALGQAMLGAVVPGYVLHEKTSNRKWVDGAQKILHEQFGDAIYGERSVKSPAQIETIKGAKAFLKQNSLTTREKSGTELQRIGLPE